MKKFEVTDLLVIFVRNHEVMLFVFVERKIQVFFDRLHFIEAFVYRDLLKRIVRQLNFAAIVKSLTVRAFRLC